MTRLKTLPTDNLATLLIFLCVVAVYGLSYYQRQAGFNEWMADRSGYVIEHVTAMSTMDSYHWLKMAREIDAGTFQPGQRDPLRGYPDLEAYPEQPSLLAHAIRFASRFTEGDYYRGALLLPPLLAGLFVFPLFLYCNTLGFGASAVLGGLIGSFSVAYHARSNHGYVDTDMLNLFFPLLVSAFIVLIGREKSFRSNLLLAICAGIAMNLFNWWYQQPGFYLIYLPFIVGHLLLIRVPWKQAVLMLLVFSVAAGPQIVLQSATSFYGFFNAYFFPKFSGQIAWPEIFETIVEAQNPALTAKLERVHGLLPMVLAGLAGLACLYALRWKRMLPITPLLLIGLWSLFGPRRFAMYLAPFIGVGIGVLIELLARQAGDRFRSHRLAAPSIAVTLMMVLFFSTTGYTAYHTTPGAMPDAATIRSVLEVKKRVPKHSAMLTWWDRGYPLMDIGEFATYHDGALHGYSRTTLIGKALTSDRQEEMAALIAYLEKHGFEELDTEIVARNLDGREMMQTVFSHPPHIQAGNIYVLYNEHMLRAFGSISMFGTWDFDSKSSDPMSYEYMNCFSQVGSTINCRGAKVDLNRGMIGDGSYEVPLKAALFVNDGNVVERIDYPGRGNGDYLQVVMKRGQVLEVQVLEERLFRTNFNQQFVLGNYDRRYFEEVYNDFPVARAFRVRNAAED